MKAENTLLPFNFLALIQGGLGEDVWDKELKINAADFQDAANQATAQAKELNGQVVQLEQNDWNTRAQSPQQPKIEQPEGFVEPQIGGRKIRGSIASFERSCLVHIERLQHSLGDYDSAMLDTFCEAVRLGREYCDLAKSGTQPPHPSNVKELEQVAEKILHRVASNYRGGVYGSETVPEIVEVLTETHASLIQRNEELEKSHCKDCCCAKSWTALDIKKYDGKSIPEHISELKQERDTLLSLVEKAKEHLEEAVDLANSHGIDRMFWNEWRTTLTAIQSHRSQK